MDLSNKRGAPHRKHRAAPKRKVSMCRAMLYLILVCFIPLSAMAVDNKSWDEYLDVTFGGTGTANDPYLITSAKELAGLSYLVNEMNGTGYNSTSKYYKLTTDIDLEAHLWRPIGYKSVHWFNGHFDGDGHTIKNMHIDNSGGAYGGLFGYIQPTITGGCTIQNLIIENADGYRNPAAYHIGIVAGYVAGNGLTITNVHVVNGGIRARCGMGGIVGTTKSRLTLKHVSCSALIDPHPTDSKTGNECGGFIGLINDDPGRIDITDCVFSGRIMVNDASNMTIGGFVGLKGNNAQLYGTRAVFSGRFTHNNNKDGESLASTSNVGYFVGYSKDANVIHASMYYYKSASNNLSGVGNHSDWGGYTQKNLAEINSQTFVDNTLGTANNWGLREGKVISALLKLTVNQSNNFITKVNNTNVTGTQTFWFRPSVSTTVQYKADPNKFYFPEASAGSLTGYSATGSYNGNKSWTLNLGAFKTVLNGKEEAYPSPATTTNYQFNVYEKNIAVEGATANIDKGNKPGKWYFYSRQKNGASWSNWEKKDSVENYNNVSFSMNVDYESEYEVGARFVVKKDNAPSTPADDGYYSKTFVKNFNTESYFEVRNFKAVGNAASVDLSFEFTSRLNNSIPGASYKILRKVNDGNFTEIGGVQDFKAKPAQESLLKYSYKDNDLGSYTSCDLLEYKIEVTAYGATKGAIAPNGDKKKPLSQVTNLAPSLSQLVAMKATKGEYTGSVRISWETQKPNPSTSDRYKLFARIAGKYTDPVEGWKELAIINTTDPTCIYNDDKALPGVYYEYSVRVYQQCQGQYIENGSRMEDIGFAQSLGNVLGRITYGSGTAVKDVSVLVKRNNLQSGEAQYYSLESPGDGSTLFWTPEENDFNSIVGGNFTYQFWLFPQSSQQGDADGKIWLASIGNGDGESDGDPQTIWLGLKKTDDPALYQLILSPNDEKITTGVIPANAYSHISVIRSGNSLQLYVVNDQNRDSVYIWKSPVANHPVTVFTNPSVRMGYDLKGNIDEVRLWKRALSETEILRDYNRMLIGSESGLKVYWTFNEGLPSYLFDISREGNAYNDHHGRHLLRSSVIIPDDDQLALKGITDADGNYEILGIPFSGDGDSYSIVPSMGVHQFQPSQHLRHISNQSLVHNGTDFTDISSFKVTGKVLYANSNYPVESVQLNVDGLPASKDGEAIMTKEDGSFTVDVPIGNHFISVTLQGHEFAYGGRYPAHDANKTEQEKLNFQKPVNGLIFYDNTKITLAGRVTGGDIQTELPLGFGLSKANIGKAVITLETKSDYQFGVDTSTAIIGGKMTKTIMKPMPVKTQVEIETDPETGEFLAILPPIPFDITGTKTKNISEKNDFVYSKENLNINPNMKYDLTYTDPETNISTTLNINDSLKITYYEDPVFSVRDKENPYGAFGDSIYVYTSEATNQKDTVRLYSLNGGAVEYALNAPVFSQFKNRYQWEVSAYEEYVNNDDEDAPVTDKVPLVGKAINITNALAAVRVDFDTTQVGLPQTITPSQVALVLDTLGKSPYKFATGVPNIGGDHLLNAKMTFDHNGKEITWSKDAYLFGQTLADGSNFVTKGPDFVDMILHDPPGSNSYAFIEKGSSYTKTDKDLDIRTNTQTEKVTVHVGPELKTAAGFGVIIINELKQVADFTGTVETEQTFGSNNETETTTTFTQRVSTSSDPNYVGSNADVYIGKSSNILFGKKRQLALYPENSNDNSLPGIGKYKLFTKEVLTANSELATNFTFTQDYILNTLIPNTQMLRNDLIIPISSSQDTINIHFGGKKVVYMSFLPPSDPDFGGPGNYYVFFNSSLPLTAADSIDQVMEHNSWIANWEDRIRDNEASRAALINQKSDFESKNNPQIFENISYDAGVSLEKSLEVSYNQMSYTITNWSVGGSAGATSGFGWNKVGFSGEGEWGSTEIHENEDGTGTSNSCTFGYVISEDESVAHGGKDALTVDVYAPYSNKMHDIVKGGSVKNLSGFTFRTQAGQTSCPYEPVETSLFYKDAKGEPVVLNNGTFQIEKPEIYIDNNKYATAENVPSGREATFIIQMQNLSEANVDVTYQLSVGDNSNPDGLILSIDGTPLTNPREYTIEYGKELTKTLKVRQSSADILEYDDIKLVLGSVCDGNIEAEAMIGVKFIPSSTDSKLTSNVTTLNLSGGSGAGADTTVTFTISEYDRKFKNFASLRLEYKNVNDPAWSLAREFINDAALRPLSDPESQELIAGSIVQHKYPMKYLPDGIYLFRSVSRAIIGYDNVDVPSNEIRITKDLKAPVSLGNPSPVNGILTPEGELSIVFNESIKAANIKDNNISVRAILNGYRLLHSTALKLSGGAPVSTEANITLANRSFSIEGWIQRTPGQSGTVFAHGNTLSVGFNADNKVVVNINGETLTSTNAFTESGWNYLTFTYDNEAKSIRSLLFTENSGTQNVFAGTQITNAYTGTGRLYIGAKADGSNAFTGAVQEVSLWNKVRLQADVAADKDYAKTGNERNLIGYWQLTEGHGTIAQDKARSRHLVLPNSNYWYLRNENKALAFNGTNNLLKLNASAIPISTDESFAIEFWFKGETQANATLFSCGEGIRDVNPSQKLSLGYANGSLVLKANGGEHLITNTNYLDNAWHHLALNVLRNGSSIVYIDGVAVKQLSGTAVAGMQSSEYVFGALYFKDKETGQGVYTTEKYFKGWIDEIRIWKAALTADVIRQSIYNRLSSDESGLVAYYPFEETYTDSGNQQQTRGTLSDKSQNDAAAADFTGTVSYTDLSPALKEARSMENVYHDFTASDSKIVINVKEPDYRIENTILEITVFNILDLNNNQSAPVKWTAYVDRNRLQWSESEISLTKQYLEGTVFEVTVSNQSGKEENWYLSNLPSWLSVSKTQGSVKPLSSEKLTFTVSESTPVGSYEEIIYLTGNNQIDAPLGVMLKVTSQKPDWSVNPSNFEESMNLIGQLKIGDKTSEDAEDIVAAFIGETCIGITSPLYDSRYDAYYVMMDIFGKTNDAGKEVIFRIWDAGTGMTYPVVTPSVPVSFAPGRLYGSMNTPVVLTAENKVEQSVALAKGWTWISLNTQADDMSVTHVFRSVQDKTILLKDMSVFAAPTGNGNWSGLLNTVATGRMYKINLNEASQFVLTGTPADPQQTPVSIRKDWNWIGYTPQFSLPLKDALAELQPEEGDMIKGQSQFAVYTGAAWAGSLQTMAPGRGYLYQSLASSVKQFHYPSVSSAISLRTGTGTNGRTPEIWTPVDETKYPGNMSIIAIVKNGNDQVLDAEVGVFANTECRGVQVTGEDDGYVFLSVAGDDNPVTLNIKVHNREKETITSVKKTIPFTMDAILGNMSNPYVIQLDGSVGTEAIPTGIRVYPTKVQNILYVESPADDLEAIIFHDLSGRVLRRIDDLNDRNTVNVSDLPRGIYMVTVEKKNGERIVVRIVK